MQYIFSNSALQLIDDVRYNAQTAAYWRNRGLVIPDEHITEPIDQNPIDAERMVK